MAKQNKTDKKIKNPLSIMLGVFLAKERNKLPDNNSSKEMSKTIGIGESFYRMIEAGSANIHPSRVLDIIRAFPLSEINLDALCKYLVAIQIVETNLSSYNTFENAISELSIADEKFQKLFKNFEPDWKEIKNLPYTTNLYNELKDFLTNYDDYASSSTEILEKQENILNNVFYELPTIYFDYVENFIKQTKKLPVRIHFDELREWEKDHMNDFSSIYAIIRNHNIVTHKENLNTYLYDYLWGKEFDNACFIFLEDEKNASDIKKIFEKNLKSSYVKKNINSRLNNFDNKIKKIKFKTYKKNNAEVNEVLNETNNKNEKINYDAIWCFTLKANNEKIGFVAKAKQHESIPDYQFFIDGKSLNYYDTKKKQKIIQNLWENNQ